MERIFVIYDSNVEAFAKKIAAKYKAEQAWSICADEQHKTFRTVEEICRKLLSVNADRYCKLIAVGGGVTTDMVGFAASIYKRGVKYENVPTTLLAQVDAAVGGKTGVNLDDVKNILGTFCKPEKVHISSEPLRTLPRRDFLSGLAELLKTFIIDDRDAYEDAVALFADPALDPTDSKVEKLITKAYRIKKRITTIDPTERGVRKSLNLGHTFGHAISWWQAQEPGRTDYSHGETVAIGTVLAAKIAENMGEARPGLADKLASDFKRCGLPVELPCPPSELIPAVLNDKKARKGKISFVLPCRIGTVVFKDLTEDDLRKYSE